MSAKYKSPSFLLPNEINTNTNPLNTDGNPATGTGINSLYSMDFDGSSEYINAGSTPQALVGSNSAYTVSAWVKPDATGNQNIIGAMDSGNRWYFRVLNGYASYAYGSAANGNDYQGTATPVALNTWSHVIFTFDGSTTHKIYVNGVLKITQSNGSAQTITNSQNAYIGALNNNGSTQNYFDGKIDEVAIWARALSDGSVADGATATGEVATVYNSGKPGNLIASNLNPVAYYPLGEQAQNTGFLTQEITNGWQFPNGVLQDYVMDFDGSTDFIDTSYTGLNGSSQTTISFWLNTSNTNQNAHFFGNRVVNNGLSSQFFTDGNTYIHLNSQSFSFNTSTYFSNNTWHNFVIVFNGSLAGANRLKAYVDNTPITFSSVSSTTISASTSNLLIGYSPTGGYFNGKLSNFVLWNTDQSANIANIYNNGSPQTSYTVSPQNWWKLNADSVYTPSAPNYTTSLNLPQPLSASNYIDFPTGGSGWSFNDGAGNDTPFTVSAWVYNTSSTFKYRLLSKNDGGNGYEYSISAGGANALGSIEIYLYDSTGSGTYIGSKSTLHKPNEWVHVAFTYDASAAATGLKIYANGEQLTDTDITVGSYTSMGIKTSKPNIGRTVTTVGSEGNVSNLTVFNSELTASQISTLFNFGTPETTPSFSPTLWFKLDNTTTGIQSAGSLTGASYNGTIGGSVTATSPAGVAVIPSWKIPSALTIPSINYTSALKLESSNSESVAFSSSINTSSTTTFSMWLKPTSTNNQYLLPTGSGVNGILIRNSKIYFYDFNAGSGFPQSSDISSTLADGNWHHLAITRDNRSVNFYLDGNTVNTGTPTFTADFTSFNISDFGKTYNTGQGAYYDGEVSNLAIFNSVLSLANIQTLYNNGQPQDSISFTPTNWFKLNSINGTTVTDTNGSNNGTTSGSIETTDVKTSDLNIPVNGVSTTLPSTALQQSDLQFDSPYSNYSLSFDGATNYIDCTNYQFSTTKTSISAWFKSSDTRSSEFTEILSKYSDTSAEFQMRLNANLSGGTTKTLSVFLLQSASTYVICTTTSTWNDGNWHNVIFTYDSSFASGKLYVDGTLQASDTTTLGVHTPGDANLYIGARQSNSIEKEFLGNIDEVSIWKGTYLSEAQVLEIYNNGKPSNLQNFSGTLPSSWWRLGENAYFDNNSITVPNSISGAPNGVGPGTVVNMLTADAPGTYANGVGTNLDIVDRIGDAPLSTSNSQSYNMIPDDKVSYVPGYVGNQISNTYSMIFDGVDDYFDAGTSLGNTLGVYNGSLTISLWYKHNANAYNHIFNMKPSDSTTHGELTILNYNSGSDNVIYCQVNQNTGSRYYITNTTAYDTNWHHLVFKLIYDSSAGTFSLELYIDGASVAVCNTSACGTVPTTGTIDFTNGSTFIGGGITNRYYNGNIDEVAIFDTALSPGQIYNDIYQPTATGTNQTADLANNPNLPTPVAWYRMGD